MLFNFPLVDAEFEEEEPETLPAITHKDLESIRNGLKTIYDDQISALENIAEAHQIVDDDTEKLAVEMAGQTKDLTNRLDKERKCIIKEPDDKVRAVNRLVKGFRDRLNGIEKTLNKKVTDNQWQKELDRRKRELEAQEAARALQARIDAEAKAAGVEPPIIPIAMPVEKKVTIIRTESGASAHMHTEWRMNGILDMSMVPDEYKIIDEAKVNSVIKAGIREIPGLTIKEVPITIFRR